MLLTIDVPDKLKMFNLIEIGERAGSDVPDIFAFWEQEGWKEPEIKEQYGSDQAILILPLAKKQVKKQAKKRLKIEGR